MENYSFITNNCLGSSIYQRLKREYDNPFMGSYFQDDDQYLKFCLNFEYYINLEPTFSSPKLPIDTKNSECPPDSFPVMFLEDIEIHWIHETDKDVCLDKYKRRIDRMKNKFPFFIWGDSLLHRPHTEKHRENLIIDFMKIKNSIYFNKYNINEWKDKSFEDRKKNSGWAQPLNWLDSNFIFDLLYKYFEHKKSSNLIVFSRDRPMQLHRLLESLNKNCLNLFDHVDCLYTYSNLNFKSGYELLKNRNIFKNVSWTERQDFYSDLTNVIEKSKYELQTFIVDDTLFFKTLSLEEIYNIKLSLIDESIFTFMLGVGHNINSSYSAKINFSNPSFINTKFDNISIFNWKKAEYLSEFNCPFMLVGNMYKKSVIFPYIKSLKNANNPSKFEAELQTQFQYPQNINLGTNLCGCLNSSCLVSICNNRVIDNGYNFMYSYPTEILNEKYLNNFIIDIQYDKYKNINNMHIEEDIIFKEYVI